MQIDIMGQKFGKLTVVSTENVGGRIVCLCMCDCGNTVSVRKGNLGKTTNSCGCIRLERIKCGETAVNNSYRQYTYDAKNNHREFLLSKEEFRTLVHARCYYCGRDPEGYVNSTRKTNSYKLNGLDRVDNNTGYITGNVVTCCTICNYAKRNMPQTEFLSWINDLVIHHTEKRQNV